MHIQSQDVKLSDDSEVRNLHGGSWENFRPMIIQLSSVCLEIFFSQSTPTVQKEKKNFPSIITLLLQCAGMPSTQDLVVAFVLVVAMVVWCIQHSKDTLHKLPCPVSPIEVRVGEQFFMLINTTISAFKGPGLALGSRVLYLEG